MKRANRRRIVLFWVVCLSSSLCALSNHGWSFDEGLVSGIDKTKFDPAIRPGDDFFRHVNGAWLAKKEIPPDRPLAGSFVDLLDESEAALRTIIEEAAKSQRTDDPIARKIGDLYSSYVNESAIEDLKAKPLEPILASIAAVKDKPGLIRLFAELGRKSFVCPFDLGIDTDAKKSDQYIIYLDQSGLGLPDESYYRQESFAKIRQAYLEHVAKMFELAGLPNPKGSAEKVMEIETKLAKNHWDRVKVRDDTLTYNKVDLKALSELTPGFDWPLWFDASGAKSVSEVVVREPSYFTAMAKVLDEVSVDDWKTYLSWQVLRRAAPLLSKAFVDENFSFYSKTLTGTPQNRPRWKRGVQAVEGAMGQAVGKLYVEKHFPPEAKVRMKKLVENLIGAYREDIEHLEWMSPETRKQRLRSWRSSIPRSAIQTNGGTIPSWRSGLTICLETWLVRPSSKPTANLPS